jgi:acyl carrier protein
MSQRNTFEEVAALVRETLLLDDDEPVASEHLLFYDLSFTSMDMLDLLFRIQEHFQVHIPEGTMYALARGDVDDADFASDGVLTALGREQLMAMLHDAPPQIFPSRIHRNTLPRYCTVGAMVRLVEYKLASERNPS